MLVDSLDPMNIVIADFGFAKYGRTANSNVGTHIYSAPEVYRDQSLGLHYGSSVDIFSLGMTLLWILGVKTPNIKYRSQQESDQKQGKSILEAIEKTRKQCLQRTS